MSLTLDPLTLNSFIRSNVTWSNCVPNLSKIDKSTAVLLTIYQFFQGGILPNSTPQRGVDQTVPNLENRAPSSLHQTRSFGTDTLLRFEKSAAQRRVVLKNEAKFHTFDSPPVKLREGWGDCRVAIEY